MATARDVINGSLRLIGALASGETAGASDVADGLVSLNRMLDRWSNERLTVNAVVREEFTLVAARQANTIGTGGNFNTTRPIRLERATLEVQDASPYEVPMDLITSVEWAAIKNKDLTSAIPTKLYASGAFPLDVYSLYPTPSAANKLVIYSWKPFTAFASANTDVSFPPGYEDALVYNLALRLASEYGKEPSAIIVMEAAESKETIKRNNIRPLYLVSDESQRARNGFDINTGE